MSTTSTEALIHIPMTDMLRTLTLTVNSWNRSATATVAVDLVPEEGYK
jgi:hypothetical protein